MLADAGSNVEEEMAKCYHLVVSQNHYSSLVRTWAASLSLYGKSKISTSTCNKRRMVFGDCRRRFRGAGFIWGAGFMHARDER